MDDSRISMEQEETSTLAATESNPLEWTEEKHYSFLKSMESTFVDQLHQQISNNGAASGQFKDLRESRWSTIDLRRDNKLVEEEESRIKVPLRNPWIKNYRSSNVQPIRKLPSYPSKAPLATTHNRTRNFQLWNQDSIYSSAEETDQNFNDQALEEGNSYGIHDMKRTRTTSNTDVVSSNDQVVPSDDIVRVPARVDDVVEE